VSCNLCNGYIRHIYKAGATGGVSTDVTSLKEACQQYGPLATTMIVYDDFDYYTGGVYSYAYGAAEGGHAVLIVGWDDPSQSFYVKNSWGTGWGEAGYFQIAYTEVGGATQFGSDTQLLTWGSGPCH